MNAVEEDEFDIQSGVRNSWAISFCVLYLLVMSLSLALYLTTVRAVAVTVRSQNPTNYLVLLLFLAATVEFGLMVGEFFARFGYFLYSDLNCQLLTFTLYGNRLIQVATALTMLYYNLLAVYLKTTRFQLLVKRYLPVLVLVLVVLVTLLVLPPTLNTRASLAQQWCEYRDQDTRLSHGWVYQVIFPFFLPLVISALPSLYLALRLKESQIIEPQKSQVLVSLAVVAAYFLFYLLYFILMIAKQVEFSMVGRDHINKLLSLSVMFIARPMFSLVGLGWHVATPLACLALDRELRKGRPGSWFFRQETENPSIGLRETSGNGVGNNNQQGEQGEGKEELSNSFSVMMLENREFHHSYTIH